LEVLQEDLRAAQEDKKRMDDECGRLKKELTVLECEKVGWASAEAVLNERFIGAQTRLVEVGLNILEFLNS